MVPFRSQFSRSPSVSYSWRIVTNPRAIMIGPEWRDRRGEARLSAGDQIIAEAVMLALGEPSYAPFRYSGLPSYERNPWLSQHAVQAQVASCQADDDRDDLIGGPSTFITGGSEQMRAISAMGGPSRTRWPSWGKRRAW